MPTSFRVVVDTNILLRGLISNRSAAGGVLNACSDRRVIILLSRNVLREYLQILTDPVIVERYPELTFEKVQTALRRFRFVGDFVNSVTCRFEFPRDPKDAKFIELAIAGHATHIVTGDGDLHWLSTGHGEAAKRFRQRVSSIHVMNAGMFLNALESESQDN